MKPHRLLSLLLLPALLPLFTSCTDTLLETPAAGNANADIPEGYYFILDTDVPQNAPQTRVAYADINHSYFEEDDRLGIYVIDSEGNRITDAPANAQYKVTNVTNIATGTVRQVLENVGTDVPRGENYRYVIYYPYDPDMTFDRLKDLTHRVRPNQHADPASTATLTPYEQSDLLWDVVSEDHTSNGTPYVEIRMDHAMANIILNIDEKYVQAGSSEESYSVYIVNSPATASGIKLTQGLETAGWGYNVPTSTPDAPTVFPSIRMWYTGYGTSGELQFRAVIPACQTISNESAFFSISAPDGTKGYKLNAPLTLKPGKNYIFNIRESGGSIIPEVTDDDSWVLDVLDPETGEPVGLLCREYLRYQPDHTAENNFTQDDSNTGKAYNNSKCINSQAWVFYNLQEGSNKIPNLNEGTVLRFLYDVYYIGNNNGRTEDNTSAWPAPHKWWQSGIFTPKHGHTWYKYENKTYGESSPEWTEFYMHGGKIEWGETTDSKNNKYYHIQNFILPDEKITNEIAEKNGHIAISSNKVEVSYSNILENGQDEDGNKVGIIVPHYLIDRRTNKESGIIETIQYPIVKIGYNQFWMSQSLRTHVLTDGTPLTSYNDEESSGINFTNGTELEAGYIYPFANIEDEGQTRTYDPAHNLEEREPADSRYRPAPLYNKVALETGLLLPTSLEYQTFYVEPTEDEIVELSNYFGRYFGAKMMTREVRTINGENFNETRYDALRLGKIADKNNRFNSFAANISGLNLHPEAYFDSNAGGISGFNDIVGGDAAILLKTKKDQYPAVSYCAFHAYNVFQDAELTNIIQNLYGADNMAIYSTSVFAPIRFLMKYRNQDDTGGSSISVTTTNTRSVSDSGESESCNIYIPIQPAD